MSRIAKWKVERTKVKVVFRLQFHATHIPQSGWDKLFVSLVPADVGKVSAKATKTNVRNGTCKWADPIYETTRLFQDPITKKYDEKLYKLVVAMGSSRSSLLGEVNINLSEYADAVKPFSVALPLQACDYGTILHVTFQLLTSKTGFREFEQQREFNEKGIQRSTGPRNHNLANADDHSLMLSKHVDKTNAIGLVASSSVELALADEVGESNDSIDDSATGLDGLSYTSEGLLVEKNDANSQDIQQGVNDWALGWNSEYSTDANLTSVCEENNRLRGRLDAAESSISQLKIEASFLTVLADKLGLETQCLQQQFASELVSAEKIRSEVTNLRSECSKLKHDIKGFQFSAKSLEFPSRFSTVGINMTDTSSRYRSENSSLLHPSCDSYIDWLQVVLLIEGQVREIQNKACIHRRDSFDFLQSDFEHLERLLENIKHGLLQTELFVPSSQSKSSLVPYQCVVSKKLENNYGGQKNRDGMADCQALPVTTIMEEKLCKLSNALEESKIENENLFGKMNKMECYYETLIHEMEEIQKLKLFELENVRTEHARCTFTISSLQDQVEKMHQEMNEQLIRFSNNNHSLDNLNKDLEKRANLAELALKKLRRNYTIAVDRLHKDLELLSFQVLSMYEMNEHFVKQALSNLQHQDLCQVNLKGSHLDLKTDNGYSPEGDFIFRRDSPMIADFQGEVKNLNIEKCGTFTCQETCLEFHADRPALATSISNADNHLASVDTKADIEFSEVLCLELTSKVIFEVFKEMMHDLNDVFKNNKGKIDELKEQLKKSNELKGSLAQNLEAARQESRILRDNETKCVAKYDDLLLKNCILDAKFQALSEENCFLAQQASENEKLIMESRVLRSQYEALVVEKGEIEKLLKNEITQKDSIRTELSELVLNFESMQEDFHKQLSVYEALVLEKGEIEKSLKNEIMQKDSIRTELGVVVLNFESLQEDFRRQLSFYESLVLEKGEIEKSLKNEIAMKDSIQTELNDVVLNFQSLREDFHRQLSVNKEQQNILDFMLEKMGDICSFMHSCEDINGSKFDAVSSRQKIDSMNYEEFLRDMDDFHKVVCWKHSQLICEKDKIVIERNNAQKSLAYAESQISLMKHKYEIEIGELTRSLDSSSSLVENIQHELQDVSKKLRASAEAEEKHENKQKELLAKLEALENELQFSLDENKKLSERLQVVENVTEELEWTKIRLSDSMHENRNLTLSEQNAFEASIELKNEVTMLNENLRCTQEVLIFEKQSKEDLEDTICGLKLVLNGKDKQLLCHEKQEAEFGERILDLEGKNSSFEQFLLHAEEHQRQACTHINLLHSQIADFEFTLVESSLDANEQMVLMKTQLQSIIQVLVDQCKILKKDIEKLHLKLMPIIFCMKEYMVFKIQLIDENGKLEDALKTLKSEFDIMAYEKGLVDYIDNKSTIWNESEDLRTQCTIDSTSAILDKQSYDDEIRRLTNLLSSFEDEVETLKTERDELEIFGTLLGTKLEEQKMSVLLMEEYSLEVKKLREQHNELTYRLSEQILKTEEFKNLSIHLRELKDKTNAECVDAQDRRESEGISHSFQESLRIAFIKEKYETQMQELQNQFSTSKKHAEELFLKFQDTVNEVENGKKREASLLKKNEELSMRLALLEEEMLILTADRKELARAYDKMDAELQCSVLTLDCCREEKFKLDGYLLECNEERTKIRVELDLVKRLLENVTCNTDTVSHRYNEHVISSTTSFGQILEDSGPNSSEDSPSHSNIAGEVGVLIEKNKESLAEVKEKFKEQVLLKIEMDHLHRELEKLKNENLAGILPSEDNHMDQALSDLQKGLLQLEKANEHLGILHPLYREFPGTGNALERVLALELELAESLQVKKKPEVRFQSSFLRQHSDVDAVFQSFRDINELIQDMLELKKKNATVETELKEMHGRYTALSLQLAEVEGERQKLQMTLKNRSLRKL